MPAVLRLYRICCLATTEKIPMRVRRRILTLVVAVEQSRR